MVLDPNDPNMMYGGYQPGTSAYAQQQMPQGITSIAPPAQLGSIFGLPTGTGGWADKLSTQTGRDGQIVKLMDTANNGTNSIVPPAPQPNPPPPSTMPSLFGNQTPVSSTFGPNSNLISTQFTPGQADASGYLKDAASQIGGASIGPLQGFGSDVGDARSAALKGLTDLGNAPSRSQTASDLYGALSKQDAANEGADIRALGQRSAALGRLGSGMVTSDAGDIFGQHEANLGAIKANLAAQTAGQEQGDILNRINAASGLAGNLGSLDLSKSGLDLNAGTAGANLALNKGNALAGLEGQTYGENMGNLNFLTGERGYQQGLDQQATDNGVRQKLLEDQVLNSDFGRKLQTANLAGEYGFGSSPTALSLANMYSGQSGDTADAIAKLLYSQGAK